MAKKQTRRSVSIRGITYDKVRTYCERHDLSMSEFVEDLISQFFDNSGKIVKKPEPKEKEKSLVAAESEERLGFDELHDAARHFTF
ncbi:MAG: hypothetical protein JRH20_07640 [Deltaproteobacteria bacterium]|nr:hypothetical protein [Deltaproteobacteria bacterium]